MIKPRAEINPMVAYKPGKNPETLRREKGLERIIKLASNENPLGSSNKAIAAVQAYMENGFNTYPDGASYELRKKISEKYDLPMDNILPTNGGDEAIAVIGATFINPGDEVLISRLTFPRYTDTSMLGSAKIINIDLKDFRYDLPEILNRITDKTRLIWLTNPNNPTGTMLSEEELFNFFDQVREDILIVYDEAYGEFVDDPTFPKDARHFYVKYPNVITLKTFSKIYGLAALRVGYMCADHNLIGHMQKARCPFNVNALAQVAAAAALDDEEFLKATYDNNIKEKEYLYKSYDELGIHYLRTQTNHIFLCIDGHSAPESYEFLENRGVITRAFGDKYLRISIGTHEENELLVNALTALIKGE